MKTKNSAWTAAEDAMLAQSVEDRVSTARLSVRLQRSEGSVKRRMRELGLAGTKRRLRPAAPIEIDPTVQAMRWLETCRSGDLVSLMDFYADTATLECGCSGPTTCAGIEAIRQYWAPKLRGVCANAFSLAAVREDRGRVVLDYTSYEAKPVRMYLSFNSDEKIIHSECGPRACRSLEP